MPNLVEVKNLKKHFPIRAGFFGGTIDYFNLIIPCGIKDYGVTSLAKELGHPVELAAVEDATVDAFCQLIQE